MTSVINRGDELREAVFFDGPEAGPKISRYWLLLVLASIIAASGVVSDSEATVIGAMIVAPLRTPILGSMLAVVLGDRRNLMRSLGLLAAGVATAIGVGFLIGLLSFNDTDVTTSDQVATWSHAGLIDLVAALAVGAVGSIALVRRDISDTLPGVAIAISLVPPLTVVGLTLSVGSTGLAWGAFLLFATNVSAIWAVGIVTMAIYKVQRYRLADELPEDQRINRRDAYGVIGVSIVAIGAILTQSSYSVAVEGRRESRVGTAVGSWADPTGWEVVDVSTADDIVVVRLEGPLPPPDVDTLPDELDALGVDPAEVEINLVPRYTVSFAVDDADAP